MRAVFTAGTTGTIQVMSLRVGVTGPTGEIGLATIAALEEHPDVDQIVGMARRAFDPGAHGWSKTTYRQGDILDRDAVDALVADVDVVVHLAFVIMGSRADMPGSTWPAPATSSPRPRPPNGPGGWCTRHRWPPTAITPTIPSRSPRTCRPADPPSTTTPSRRRRARRPWPSSPRIRRWRSTCCGRASSRAQGAGTGRRHAVEPASRAGAPHHPGTAAAQTTVPGPRHPTALVHHDDVAAAITVAATTTSAPPGAYNSPATGW